MAISLGNVGNIPYFQTNPNVANDVSRFWAEPCRSQKVEDSQDSQDSRLPLEVQRWFLQTSAKCAYFNNGTMMGIWWEYDGNMMGIWWEYDGNMMGIWWEYYGDSLNFDNWWTYVDRHVTLSNYCHVSWGNYATCFCLCRAGFDLLNGEETRKLWWLLKQMLHEFMHVYVKLSKYYGNPKLMVSLHLPSPSLNLS